MSDAASKKVVLLLARAESEIGLLDRARPIGVEQECRRLLDAWRRGQTDVPRLRYGSPRPLLTLQRALEGVAEGGWGMGPHHPWLIERAAELLLEARMVETIGTKAFIALACQRFASPTGAGAIEFESMARTWIAEGARLDCHEACFRSDDPRQPQSLWSVLSRRIGQLRAPLGIRIDPDLMSVAACTESAVVIRADTWLTEQAAERIAAHEIEGHLLPRYAARSRFDPLRCGCARSSEEEEGRALLIERRLGLMDVWRRAELGARHLACAFLRRGATFVDAVRVLEELGASTAVAIRAMLRAMRGGGLAREIVYLPAMQRLELAFSVEPDLEQWFCTGRASLRYAVSERAAARAA